MKNNRKIKGDNVNKKVYIAMSADVLHTGHLNIIKKGLEFGTVTIGVLTDKAIAEYKRVPYFDLETRKEIFKNIKGVSEIVVQDSVDYTSNLLSLKPDYVVHGDDWREGSQKLIREKVIEILGQWNGELIEIPYTQDFSSSAIIETMSEKLKSPDYRRPMLRRMLRLKPYIRVMEASNGLTGLIVEKTKVIDSKTSLLKEFDAMWVSSLCDSTFKGKPDIELVDLTSRINTINEIMEVTSKPIILDGDTGGREEHFVYNVQTLERLGVSAVIIEDKTGLKRNSLFGTSVKQTLEEPEVFGHKIKAAKAHLTSRDFMIFARLESLIAGHGVDDAIKRAKIYIDYGADGIMIHSKDKNTEKIEEFMIQFREFSKDIPLIVVPTAYNHMTEEKLHKLGANVIIHANHLLRSAYPAMVRTAKTILEYGRSQEVDSLCTPIKEIIELIPGSK